MTTTTHNHATYQHRLDFVQELLREKLDLQENVDIFPIAYDPDCPFKYNNFVYRVSLPSSISQKPSGEKYVRQPGCVPIPNGTKDLILRLSNPLAEGLHQTTRIENEVAIIALSSAALCDIKPPVVPSVYAWGSAKDESSYGWILQELLPGTPLDEAFDTLDIGQKKQILVQMAKILKGFQDYHLPESITEYGGVTFDDDGCIISAVMPTVGKGPWSSYEASFNGRLQVALGKADVNPYIQGWRANGVRDRLEAFIERGVSNQFNSLSSKHDKAIIHADFTTNNILFDAASGRITGLIDYDFACILHPSYEFLRSFSNAGGQFRGWSHDQDSEEAALMKAKVHGFPSPLPPSTKEGVDWEVAKAWEEALEEVDVKRPSTISGIDKVADVDTVLRTILPWRLSNSDVLKMQSEEVIMKCKADNEVQLVMLLNYLGF